LPGWRAGLWPALDASDRERDRQPRQPVDPGDALVHRVSLEPQSPHVLGEEGEALLELDPREVCPEAVVHAGPERQRPRAAPRGGDVKTLGPPSPPGVLVQIPLSRG